MAPTSKASKARADKAVYAAVTDRDQLFCRACGTYAGISAHRHHLKGRAFTTVEDVCLLCPSCHADVHVRVGGKRLKFYGDANVRRGWAPDGLTIEVLRLGKWIVENNR